MTGMLCLSSSRQDLSGEFSQFEKYILYKTDLTPLMICYGLSAYISNWMTGSVLESSSLMNQKQMTLTSSTRTLMPYFPSRIYKRQVTLISWVWWLTRCCRNLSMGFNFLLCKTFPSCSLLSMKDCKVGLIITFQDDLQDFGQAMNKKSKVINFCGRECTPGSGYVVIFLDHFDFLVKQTNIFLSSGYIAISVVYQETGMSFRAALIDRACHQLTTESARDRKASAQQLSAPRRPQVQGVQPH